MPRDKKPRKHTRHRDKCPCGLDERFGDCCGSPEGLRRAAMEVEVGKEVERAEERAVRSGREAAVELCERATTSRDGKGVAQDPKKAFAMMSRAAEMGCVDAMWQVGAMLQQGEGVKKDLKKSVEMFRRASDKGYAMGAVIARCVSLAWTRRRLG